MTSLEDIVRKRFLFPSLLSKQINQLTLQSILCSYDEYSVWISQMEMPWLVVYTLEQ